MLVSSVIFKTCEVEMSKLSFDNLYFYIKVFWDHLHTFSITLCDEGIN